MATLVNNKKAHFDYIILESFEAGIELFGHEVKSLKNGQGSLEGAYVIIRGGEAYVMNMFIPPYQEHNSPKDYDPRRIRTLLLGREQIQQLADVEQGNGLTIVPISIYNKSKLVKVSIAIVKGKKQFDKRETTKKREVDRNVRREFRDR